MSVSVVTVTATTRTGKALAAFVAAGVGCAALGLFTVLAEVSVGLRNLLNFHTPVGPLSGKTTFAVVAWLIAWLLLARAFRDNAPAWKTGLTIAFVLIGLGFVGTFPSVFELFTMH